MRTYGDRRAPLRVPPARLCTAVNRNLRTLRGLSPYPMGVRGFTKHEGITSSMTVLSATTALADRGHFERDVAEMGEDNVLRVAGVRRCSPRTLPLLLGPSPEAKQHTKREGVCLVDPPRAVLRTQFHQLEHGALKYRPNNEESHDKD